MNRLLAFLENSLFAVASLVSSSVSSTESILPIGQSDLVKVWERSVNHGPTKLGMPQADTRREISNPERIKAILEFVNARPNSWHRPLGTMPAGDYRLTFYRGKDPIGFFGVGPNFFLAHPDKGGTEVLAEASREEVEEFQRLIR